MSRVDTSRWLAHPLAALILVALVYQIVFEFRTEPSAAILDIGLFIFLLATTAVGWLLAWKRPRNPLGWLLLAVPGFYMLVDVPTELLDGALRGVVPGAYAWTLWFTNGWSWLPPVGLLFTQIPMRFPDGRLPSPRWRWFSWFTIVSLVTASFILATSDARVGRGIANPTYIPWSPTELSVLTIVGTELLPVVSIVGSLASLFIRYRRADAVARAQLRWVFWGAAIPIGLLTLDTPVPSQPGYVISIFLVTYALIPIAIGVAVMRYGLYGIDRIISRTVSYVIVTVVVVGVYVGVVLGIGALLPRANSVGIAIATLAAAAVFLPLLRVVQRVVDRRFNRAAYNAQKVVDAFGERLRSGADPHAAGADLVSAVNQTLQPAGVGIWTRTVAPARAGIPE
jgi:hypothetical protein